MWLQAHSPEGFERISEVLHDLFPEVIRINAIPTSDDKAYLTSRESGLKRPVKLWQMSDGFLALTALLSLIFAPPELAGTLYCVEEPENHLHPRLMETVVSLLRQVRQEVRDSKQHPTQILITTQSPYLVNHFSLDEVIWIQKKNGETKASRPSSKTDLKKLVEDKELGLGDLMMYAGVLGDEK
jgi:predicted ATPase